MVFPRVFLREHFDDLEFTQANGLTLEHVLEENDFETLEAKVRRVMRLGWDETWEQARREIQLGEDGRCRGVGPDEEYRETENCGYRHWFLMNVYLAYLTDYQTLWVSLIEDMWALGFDGSFEKHVGMTVDEFYDSYNAFMREGDPDDPPPDGFFPTEPLSELVDFWAIESG